MVGLEGVDDHLQLVGDVQLVGVEHHDDQICPVPTAIASRGGGGYVFSPRFRFPIVFAFGFGFMFIFLFLSLFRMFVLFLVRFAFGFGLVSFCGRFRFPCIAVFGPFLTSGSRGILTSPRTTKSQRRSRSLGQCAASRPIARLPRVKTQNIQNGRGADDDAKAAQKQRQQRRNNSHIQKNTKTPTCTRRVYIPKGPTPSPTGRVDERDVPKNGSIHH